MKSPWPKAKMIEGLVCVIWFGFVEGMESVLELVCGVRSCWKCVGKMAEKL